LLQEIGVFFGSSAAFALNCLLVTDHMNVLQIAAKALEGGITINSANGVRKEWRLNANRRNARKFLSRVRRINK